MGAVDTMEVFFEKLNGGDREGAVALMDEQTEMRVHVGDSVQTLRGVDRVGGWFLRGDKGLRMIPGEVRDLGNTYQADILVVAAWSSLAAPRCVVPGRGRQDHGDQPGSSLGPARTASAWPWRPQGDGDGELVSLIDEGEGRGITSTSPSWILFGSLICGFAATSCACVMWNLLAIRARVSPFAIV